jgi:bacterioferritin-associated ferredoxin
MYVCICKNVTDRQIRKAVYEHDVSNVRELRSHLGGACGQCGKCARDARELIRDAAAEKRQLEQGHALAA